MDDAVAGWDDAQVLELRHRPAHHAVSLTVPFELRFQVVREGVRGSRTIDTDRVVDHHLDRHDRIDATGIQSARDHRVAHGSQVDQQRHTGRIRHQHPNRMERELARQRITRRPARQGGDIVTRYGDTVFVTQEVFQKHLQRDRHPLQLDAERITETGETMISYLRGQVAERAEGICHGCRSLP